MKGAEDTMITFLEERFSVKFGEFGSFRVAINAESKDDESEVNASSIIRRKIIFTPGSKFKAMLNTASIELVNDGISANNDYDQNAETPGDGSSGGDAPDPSL